MTTALDWLTATTLLTAVLWVPYILERMMSLGIMGALGPVGPDDIARQAPWAQRARSAHYNAVENLVVFATLVLVAASMGIAETANVVLATQIYFVSRLVHFPVATLGVPGLRTVSFLGGFVAQVMLGLAIFGLL